MILTKEMAEKAKALIDDDCGICWAIEDVSGGGISLYERGPSFWYGSDYPEGCFKWGRFNQQDTEKRRIFIDSLIGKDL